MNKSGRLRARALNSDKIAGFLSKNAFLRILTRPQECCHFANYLA